MLTMKNKFLALALALAMPFLLAGCIQLGPFHVSGTRYETVIRPASGFFSKGRILLIEVTGAIDLDSGGTLSFFQSQGMVSSFLEQLRSAKDAGNIDAVILRVNSPGGGVTASDIMYREMKSFKEETGIPVYAIMLDVAASGGYYISMAADEVSAHPTTVTGSIGVIASFPNIQKLADWVGVYMRDFTSGRNKSMGSPFKPFTEEQEKIIQGMIDSMYEKFLNVCAAGRPKLAKEKLRELADGRIYTADDALRVGLIDRIEYMEDLVKRIEDKQGGSMTIVTYGFGYSEGSSLYLAGTPVQTPRAESPAAMPSKLSVELPGTQQRMAPGFYYLWAPGLE